MYKYRMEFILVPGHSSLSDVKAGGRILTIPTESLVHHHTIDPFSADYCSTAPTKPIPPSTTVVDTPAS